MTGNGPKLIRRPMRVKQEEKVMIRRLSAAAVLAILVLAPNTVAGAADEFPNVVGVWTGTYDIAFSKGHGHFEEEAHGAQMELHITKQDKNLIWAKNRWQVNKHGKWHDEHATGTFDLLERTKLNIVEIAPTPAIGSTGFFEGHVKDGKMYLVYKGIGNGVSFAVVLARK